MPVAERCRRHLRHAARLCSSIAPRPNRPSTSGYGLVVRRVGPTTLTTVGELDLASAQLLAGALLDPQIERIDLRDLTFVDAAGIAVLVEATAPGVRRRPLILAAPSPAVRRLVELCTLDTSLMLDS